MIETERMFDAMESEGETIPLQDVGSVHSNVVLRRNRTSTSGRRRNVAIIEETLVSVDNNSIHQELTLLNSGENYYAVDHKSEQDAEDSISGQVGPVSVTRNIKHQVQPADSNYSSIKTGYPRIY